MVSTDRLIKPHEDYYETWDELCAKEWCEYIPRNLDIILRLIQQEFKNGATSKSISKFKKDIKEPKKIK
jgi:hypothetical protein